MLRLSPPGTQRFGQARSFDAFYGGGVSNSASINTWSGIFGDECIVYQGPENDITHIVDRVGGGDGFMAGIIYGLSMFPGRNQKVVNFAVAASALKIHFWETLIWLRLRKLKNCSKMIHRVGERR